MLPISSVVVLDLMLLPYAAEGAANQEEAGETRIENRQVGRVTLPLLCELLFTTTVLVELPTEITEAIAALAFLAKFLQLSNAHAVSVSD